MVALNSKHFGLEVWNDTHIGLEVWRSLLAAAQFEKFMSIKKALSKAKTGRKVMSR
jgi:hypothetical protein